MAADGCVPLMRARPSFGPSTTGARPAARNASAPGRRPPSRIASPSPTSTSEMCASGARSPLAPTDPREGTTGCTRAFSSADQRIERARPHAGIPARQHVGPERHGGAHGASRQRLADAGGVTAEQVQLQGAQRVVRDSHVGERSEAGVDAVDGFVALGLPGDHGARRFDALTRGRGETDRSIVVSDRGDVLERRATGRRGAPWAASLSTRSTWSRHLSSGDRKRAPKPSAGMRIPLVRRAFCIVHFRRRPV